MVNMRSSNRVYSYFIILFFFCLFVSCNVEKNRKLLSVFFDGVPEKKIESSSTTNKWPVKKRKTINTVQILSIHPDYKTKHCSKCHTHSVSSFLKTDRKQICFTCHKQEKFTGKYVHGPVAVKACNVCHDPHKSVNRKLLVEDGKNLCILCHKIPITNDPLPCKGDDCLECHTPHVADNKFFLKGGENQKIFPAHVKNTIRPSMKKSGVLTKQKQDPVKSGNVLLFKVRASDHSEFSRIVVEGDLPFKYKTFKKENTIGILFLEKSSKLLSVKNVSGDIKKIKFIKENNTLRFNVGNNYKILKIFEITNPFRVVFDIKENKGDE